MSPILLKRKLSLQRLAVCPRMLNEAVIKPDSLPHLCVLKTHAPSPPPTPALLS